ncbi:MAG: ATP-binding protein [Pyrinomonadaceae bacterium]|nr:ATP-binding protein [Pyrinomonadaceae bacterium]
MSQKKAIIHPFSPDKSSSRSNPDLRASKASDAGEETEVCQLCFGTGMEFVDGKGVRPCQCRKKRNHSNLIEKARIPFRYENCHFHNYKSQNPTQELAFTYSSRLAMEFPAVERGLVLMGGVGVGKTHLAVSILKGLTERGFTCLFYEFGSLLKEIQDSYNAVSQSSELKVLAPVLEAEILVLDEIGASKPTDWVRDTMAHIINTRYNDKKLTVFTTNFLDKPENTKEETLEDRIGVRLRSRLFEMSKTIVMGGQDYRRRFDKNA